MLHCDRTLILTGTHSRMICALIDRDGPFIIKTYRTNARCDIQCMHNSLRLKRCEHAADQCDKESGQSTNTSKVELQRSPLPPVAIEKRLRNKNRQDSLSTESTAAKQRAKHAYRAITTPGTALSGFGQSPKTEARPVDRG